MLACAHTIDMCFMYECAVHQALEKIHREKFGGGGTATQFEDEAVPELLRRSIAVYEAARCVIGYMTPFYDEISKVAPSIGIRPCSSVQSR